MQASLCRFTARPEAEADVVFCLKRGAAAKHENILPRDRQTGTVIPSYLKGGTVFYTIRIFSPAGRRLQTWRFGCGFQACGPQTENVARGMPCTGSLPSGVSRRFLCRGKRLRKASDRRKASVNRSAVRQQERRPPAGKLSLRLPKKTKAGTRITRSGLERTTGIEPATSAWEANILPLNYVRG